MTPKDATYKLLQRGLRERYATREIATSIQLRDYEKEHGISALRMAKMVKRKLDADPAT